MHFKRRGANACIVLLAALAAGLCGGASRAQTAPAQRVAVITPIDTLPFSRAAGGMLDPANPFGSALARQNTTDHIATQMLVEAQQAEDRAYRGILDGTYAPDVRFTKGRTDVAAMLAHKIVAAGYDKMNVRQATDFLNDREADYERAMGAEGLPADSLTSACAYWVESLYVAGRGSHAIGSDRDGVRATCVLEIGKTEQEQRLLAGHPLDNEQRYTIARVLSMLGATLRTLAGEPAQKAAAADGARATFKSNFGYALDDVAISRFPCVLSENKMADCETLMSRFGSRLPEIARRNS